MGASCGWWLSFCRWRSVLWNTCLGLIFLTFGNFSYSLSQLLGQDVVNFISKPIYFSSGFLSGLFNQSWCIDARARHQRLGLKTSFLGRGDFFYFRSFLNSRRDGRAVRSRRNRLQFLGLRFILNPSYAVETIFVGFFDPPNSKNALAYTGREN